MKSRVWLCVVICALLLLSGCAGVRGIRAGETPGQTAARADFVQSGRTGLEMTFVRDFPPAQIFSTFPLIALLELENTGTYPVGPESCFITLSGFDPSIIQGMPKGEACPFLEPKSIFNPTGGFDQIEFRTDTIRLPEGSDVYDVRLTATACYQYETKLSTQICVDSNLYSLSPEQKACEIRNPSVGSGQGAPVGIDSIAMKMVGSKALLEISVSNAGRGQILRPEAALQLCPQGITHQDLDVLDYSVDLPAGQLERCTPRDFRLRLSQGKGKIFCTFDIPSGSAFETPLQVELRYNYMDALTVPVQIVRTPQ